MYETGKQFFSQKVALYHYYGTAKSTYVQYIQAEKVKYKKYIYALRPLLACKYIEDELVRYEQISKSMVDDRVADWTALNIIFLKALEEQ